MTGDFKEGRGTAPSTPAALRRAAPVAAGLLVVGATLALLSCWPLAVDLVHPLLVVLVVLAAARTLGAWIHRGSLEEELLSGLVMISLMPVINHVVGLKLAPAAWWVVLGFLAVAAVWPRTGTEGVCGRVLRRLERDAEDAGVLGILLFLPAAGVLAWAFVVTLAPPVGMDTLTYHLGLPAQYLARGHLVPPDDLLYYGFTQTGEMLALVALAADSSGRASQILLGLALPLGAVASGRLAAELAMGSDRRSRATASLARVLGFAAIATLPMALFTVAHGKTDALATALTLAASRRVLTRSACPFRASFLLGAALSAKLSAVFAVAPLAIWLAWTQRRRWRLAPVLIVLFALVPGSWMLRNLFVIGLPVPASVTWSLGFENVTAVGLGASVLRLFGAMFVLVDNGIDGPVGPLPAALAALCVAGLFAGRTQLRAAAMVSLASLGFWLAAGGGSHGYAHGGLVRFLLPGLALFAAAGSTVAAELIHPKGGRTSSGKLLGSLFVVAAATSALAAGAVLGRAFPAVDVLTGRMTKTEYLRLWVGTGPLQEEAARLLPTSARVLSVGETRLFPLRRDARFAVDADLPIVYRVLKESNGDTRALDDRWRRDGWTHVLHAADVYARNIVVGLTSPPDKPEHRAAFEAWLTARGRMILEDDAEHVSLHELIPDSFPAASREIPPRH